MRLDEKIDTEKATRQSQGKPQNSYQKKPAAGKSSTNTKSSGHNKPASKPVKAPQNAAMGNAFADAFAKIKK
jgi:uncharacterized protein